ncbi:protein BIG GRAIN 1-like B [Argentina anserina]|uniref:protein BIG GRAIN 1-like B n=1 Tax=Argentina anserina TaxID=57926 RepID=UPI002176400A|nr:protein BIG GRAIN 1-like B [Potentilla anserina]
MASREHPSSFSSSLLDKIYRSIDEGERRSGDVRFYGETKTVALPERNSKSGRDTALEEEMAALRRACLIEKWIEKKAAEKEEEKRRQSRCEMGRRSRKLERDHDDGVFFSSNSCSSESSSGGFSSSDAESMYGSRPPPRSSCFVPSLWPKPIRTSVQTRPAKTEEKKTDKKQSARSRQQRDIYIVDDYRHSRDSDRTTIKSKSRALKVYDNLKKVKQPISPGGRVASFLNSLFTTGQVKKSKTTSSLSGYEDTERRIYSLQGSTCSSASSFSRSCLSKNSPNTRERLRNGVKKSVQFYPVSVVVGKDCQPCGKKCGYEEQDAHPMPVTVPTAWKIGRAQTIKTEEEIVKLRVLEKSRQAEDAAREFLKDHRRNQVKNESLFNRDYDNHDDDMDDDAASCSSSDLFELDHLAVVGKERYLEELPVYETTLFNRTNRAIF